jgi:PAS domain S-box-containing protein
MADAVVPIRLLYVDAFESGQSPLPALERAGGFDVAVAQSGTEGRSLLDDDVDCVLCGAELPDESGLDFCADLRADHAVSVVVVGDEPAAELADEAVAAGAADYVSRDLLAASPELVATRLRRVVESAREESAPSLLEALPLPVVVAGERVRAANDAARDRLGGGDALVGRTVASLFEGDDPVFADDDGTTRRRIDATGAEVTVSTASLPASPLHVATLTDGPTGDADATLVQKANMLDSILERIPLAVYFKDRDGRHVAVSDFLPQMNPDGKIINPEGKVHHTADAIIGKTDFDLYPSELAEQTAADEEEIVETEEPLIHKIERTYTPDQELMRLSTSKAPWYGPDGEVRGIVGITVDITDEKRYEDTVDYQDSVLELVETVLEEPISQSIAELAEIGAAADGDESTDVTRSVEAVVDHVEVVETLLTDGRQEFGTELVDLERIASDAWAALETDEATMTVTYNGIIRADPDKLSRLFTELFENALVHAGPEVTVTVEQFEDGFFVADDGPGVPPGERRQIFEYGYTTVGDRIGSGLTIAETIAESLGWELTVVGGTDGGCRFEVTGVVFE